MRKIYVRDVACFILGAWIAWYEVTEDKANAMAWALAAVLLSGPAVLNIFAKVLQQKLMTGPSEPSQASSASDVSQQRSLP